MILSGILVPLRALIIGALGAAIAWGWYNDYWWLSVAAPLGVAAIGWIVSEAGVRGLPENPVNAIRLMPWRVLVPAVIAAAAAGAVIIATVELTLPDEPTPSTDVKEIVAALSGAITAFLGAAFIDWAGDGKDSRIADWISSTFYEKYEGQFEAGSAAANYLYSPNVVDGWGPAAREKRAKGIADAIAAGNT